VLTLIIATFGTKRANFGHSDKKVGVCNCLPALPSASVDAETRRELKGNVPDETTTIYAGTILGRSRTAIRLRIDSITLNEFKEATHVKLRQPLRSKGDVWTFVRRGNGLAPQGQDHTFRLQEAIDD
jgi:hypothetical protein